MPTAGAVYDWTINGVKYNVRSVDDTDSPVTAAYGDLILCNCASNPITVNLPSASGASGKEVTVKKIDSSANAVTLDGSGAETIDGSATDTIDLQYSSVTMVSDGTNMVVV